MPDVMFDAYKDCVLYDNKNDKNEGLVYRSLELGSEKLLRLGTTQNGAETLARLQALLLYQSMQLFDHNLRPKSLAESRMGIFQQWTDHLSNIRDASAEFSEVGSERPATWKSWVFAESLRRTIIACWSLITVVQMLKQETCAPGAWMGRQPWTLSKSAWEAVSSFDFDRAWDTHPPEGITCLELDGFLAKGKPDDVDEFGRCMLVIYVGLDATKEWFRNNGSVY
ncbi:hypothetical protein QM012_000036 [Aureobasidium pullulans]|uniref:Transcription factor domain-containing protein n=1 Tax=Aureobasidium pullulans TaxID=5580 RepID=A0ABR0TUK8_AURPU